MAGEACEEQIRFFRAWRFSSLQALSFSCVIKLCFKTPLDQSMKRILLISISLLFLTLCSAQVKQYYDVNATIVQENSDIPLAYANILNKQQLTGTASNMNGYFELPACRIGDSLFISYLGY